MTGNSSTREDLERTLKQTHRLLVVSSTGIPHHHRLLNYYFINCNEVLSSKLVLNIARNFASKLCFFGTIKVFSTKMFYCKKRNIQNSLTPTFKLTNEISNPRVRWLMDS